jgi:hypothetical protein
VNRYLEGLASNVTAVLISISMATPWLLHKFNRLCIRRKQTNKRAITNLFTSTFLHQLHNMASTFTDIQFSSVWKRNSKVLEDSRCILHFTCTFFNSLPQFLPCINCTGTDLGLPVPPTKKIWQNSSQKSVQARKNGASYPQLI